MTQRIPRAPSPLEAEFDRLVRVAGLPEPVREYRFCPGRRWRLDFAWPDARCAVEVEGGTWAHGRHTSGSGFEKDVEKYNCLTSMGWKLYRVTTTTLRDPWSFLAMLAQALGCPVSLHK